ncbi:hypothetical protein A2U01_0041192 [Trifolium medium]|uniref:Uncharacterized protein n=1 Tax=Trifolium medium TaxID=97028 RepID=A0A392Q6U3_9FABA|nr:hypothetical protein [Trifolium medium]
MMVMMLAVSMEEVGGCAAATAFDFYS